MPAWVLTYLHNELGSVLCMAIVIAVANLKGGSGKTTTTGVMARVLANAGLSVRCVDTDPQGSLLRWSEVADWDIPTLALPTKMAHKQLPALVGDAAVVMVDTPPLAEDAGIVASVLRVADLVVVPCAPTPLEAERLPAVRKMIDDSAAVRPSGDPPKALVVLCRTVANAVSTQVWRSTLTDQGWVIADWEIRRREHLAQAFGDDVRPKAEQMYEPVVDQVLSMVLGDDQ